MPSKRAAVPENVFGQKGTALDKLTGRTPSESGIDQEHSNTVLPQSRDTVVPQDSADQETREKLSVYLSSDQVDKLDDLAREYRQRTRKRISRVEVVRRLIDAGDLQMVLDGDRS